VASAAFGPWCAGYGTPRDWVIGCRVVGIDGKEVRAGGVVVKNVAGYDLPKLYTGSFGTLGLITEVTFKVMPIPGVSGYCTVACDTPEQAEQLIAGIRNSDLLPAVVELSGPLPAKDHGPWRLFVQFLHVPEAVDWQVDYLAALAGSLGARPARLSERVGGELLAELRETPHSLPFVARIGTLSSRVAEVSVKAAEIIRSNGHAPVIQAHAAYGRVYALAPTGDRALAEAVRGMAQAAGASCVFPRLPDALVGELDPWGDVGPERRLLEGIKRTASWADCNTALAGNRKSS
jgi:glycolate oxidase FAD binding subunit